MRPGGQPDTLQEAATIVEACAATNFNRHRPAHYPESQIIALSQLVTDLTERVQKLEAKPKRGRPPKAAASADVDLVQAEIASRRTID